MNLHMLEGDKVSGYTVRRVAELSIQDSTYYELEHLATGARHIHIRNDIAENTFAVAFKTVPKDSTGVAHILEHTVLCGSRKYPVRDPFFSMLKRSLSSFMNAFTASDWTMYPFSTQNRKDFFNLMAVYLDAAFFPVLDPLNFKQEGHRIEFEVADGGKDTLRLAYKGIVYNEMKGAMSSPEQVMNRSILHALFPETTYSENSGGDPRQIPRLTHRQLVEFHRKHYHPSNAFFYTYGDIPLDEILLHIEENALNGFSRIDPETEVDAHRRWIRPKRKIYRYPLSKEEVPARKCQSCIAWLTADIRDSFETLCFTMLEQILLGNSGSPIRKALIDSGLGASLSDGTGFYSDLRDTVFCCGLKEIEKEAASEVEGIVFSVLKDLVSRGIDKALIESAIHQIEFHRKEVTNHPYPYGLKMLVSFAGSWFHGGDPLRILNFSNDIEKIRQSVNEGPFFENRIQENLLNNPHRVRVTLVPDQTMEEKETRRVSRELKSTLRSMGPSDIEKIKADAQSLMRLQESDEDLSCLPTLELKEIPPSVHTVAENGFCPSPASCYRQPTSGIFYLTVAIGCGTLSPEQMPYVPFFCYAFSRTGTRLRGYEDMARRIDAYTGGIGLSAHARTRFGRDTRCLPHISFSGKCLYRNEDRMFEIVEELLFQYDLSDLTRIRHLLLQYRAGLESGIIPQGHRLAMLLAARSFSVASALEETWNGVHQFRFLKSLTEKLTDSDLEQITENLRAVGKALFRRSGFKSALIGESPAVSQAIPPIEKIHGRLDSGEADAFAEPAIPIENRLPREAWTTASAVSFVARSFQTVRMDHPDSPALLVISKLLRSLYLHREIREKGGAYGGFAVYQPESGIFSMASYRDPHIVSTLKTYDAATRFIQSGTFTDEDIREAVLQICSDIDKPDPPGTAAKKAFYRKIVGQDDDDRKRYKLKVLSMSREEVISIAERYFDPAPPSAVAVITGDRKLEEANRQMSDAPLSPNRI